MAIENIDHPIQAALKEILAEKQDHVAGSIAHRRMERAEAALRSLQPALSPTMCALIESGQLEDGDADLVLQPESGQALHCPFCGGSKISDGEILTSLPSGAYYKQSECQDCGAVGPAANLNPGEIDYGDVKAIAAWNRRTSPSPAVAQPVVLENVRVPGKFTLAHVPGRGYVVGVPSGDEIGFHPDDNPIAELLGELLAAQTAMAQPAPEELQTIFRKAVFDQGFAIMNRLMKAFTHSEDLQPDGDVKAVIDDAMNMAGELTRAARACGYEPPPRTGFSYETWPGRDTQKIPYALLWKKVQPEEVAILNPKVEEGGKS